MRKLARWVIGAGLGLGCAAAAAGAQLSVAPTVSEQYLLAAANADRAARGLSALHIDDHLALGARLHAYEMAKHRGISHQFPGEADLAKRAGDSGAHFSLVTENVAEASNSALIHDLWMHSAGHRANLLDPQVDAVGIAVVQDHGQLYAVEDFARTVAKIPLDRQEATVGELIAATGVSVAPTTETARQTCEMSTGFAGRRQPWFVMRYTAADLHRLPEELSSRLASGKYHEAEVGACVSGKQSPFTSYNVAVLLYP